MVAGTAHTQPLIVTLWMDNNAQQYFNRLREQYFPPERNYLQAHLTLFHALPYNEETFSIIEELTNLQTKYKACAERVVSIGNGTAIKIISKELSDFHVRLQKRFGVELTLQDRQKIWPHVTIQNKVDANVARSVFESVNTTFASFEFDALGVEVHRYCGGPWEALKKIKFGEGSY